MVVVDGKICPITTDKSMESMVKELYTFGKAIRTLRGEGQHSGEKKPIHIKGGVRFTIQGGKNHEDRDRKEGK